MSDTLDSHGRDHKVGITTLEQQFGRDIEDHASPLLFTIHKFWQSTTLPPFAAINAGTTVGSIEARVDDGRWVVDCPDPDCTSAQIASDTDPRFVCVRCAFGPFTVVFPKDRPAIEQTLLARPVPETRNWLPNETVGDLKRENDERLKHRKAG